MTFDPDEDKVAAAFASLRAESSSHFPPPPVNELLGRAPASLRRRRLLSLAAVVGACTAVTAGGFAVAQTLGPLTGGPESTDDTNTAVETSPSDESTSLNIGDPASPESDEGESPTVEATIPPETTLVITDPGEYGDACAAGTLGLHEDWTFADETPWAIALDAEAGTGPVLGDVNGDGADDVTAVLECHAEDATFIAGVSAFSWNEDGTSLEQLAWVWEPHTVDATAAVTAIEEGVVTVAADEPAYPEYTGEFDFEWDAEAGAFAPVEDDVTTEPVPDETTSSPAPDETPTTGDAPATTPSGS
jgi:hypothetical protein